MTAWGSADQTDQTLGGTSQLRNILERLQHRRRQCADGADLIAAALGPIGVAALLGEVIYANFGAIENAFVISGDAIASALVSAGQAYVESLETVGNALISGVSTAGAYVASGFQAIAAELSSAGLANLATEIATTITEINYIADQIGSALCDFVSSVSCLVSSIFAPPPGAELRPAPFAFSPVAAYRP